MRRGLDRAQRAGRRPLTYRGLRALVAQTLAALNARGVGRNDRVAIVLDNGPEMAAAFLCIAAGATAAPLNPVYRAEEFEFYLTDLNAKILVIERDKASPAVEVAAKLNIPIVRLVAAPDEGAGTLHAGIPGRARAAQDGQVGPAAPDDIALVLHTSGTTSRPKIVPLAHRNVCASARHIRQTLALTEADRGLNIMPLFHIHGLIAGTLAPLSAGGEVCCTTGFNALRFFSWMAEVRPTWYTAVPTMHQAILSRAPKSAEVIKANPLRFIRSSSSSLRAADHQGAGGGVRRAGDRVVRNDRGGASDGEQSAAARQAQAGHRGHRRGPGGRRDRRRGQSVACGGDWRDRDPRPERHVRLREQSQGQRRGLQQRMVPHRRPGRDGRRRLRHASPDG